MTTSDASARTRVPRVPRPTLPAGAAALLATVLAVLSVTPWATGAHAAEPMAQMAQTDAPCPATPAPLPAELAGWRHALPIAAGARASAAAMLTVGTAARATLRPMAELAVATAPGRDAPAGSNGGLLGFNVARAGHYRVALGSAPWVDVVASGHALRTIGHAHGPACSGVRKLVDFDLSPGHYLLQITGSYAPQATVMIVRLR